MLIIIDPVIFYEVLKSWSAEKDDDLKWYSVGVMQSIEVKDRRAIDSER